MTTPDEMRAGRRVTWAHYYPEIMPITRRGTVIDRAPDVDGAIVVSWVLPDVKLDTDLYAVIAVGKATRSYQPAHGSYLPGGDAHVDKGALFSSNYGGSPLGTLTLAAARHGVRVRRERPDPTMSPTYLRGPL